MLVVVSPAKRLDWAAVDAPVATAPDFQGDATYLAGVAGKLSKPQLEKLMSISPKLAALNHDRFRAFHAAPEADVTRPAMHAFAGDTYQGLDAASLDADAQSYARDHLRILSGLYGVLRPFDGIQPYRLEMGSRLKTRAGGTLYAYWGDRIAGALAAQAEVTGSRVLVNCASVEYFSAVDLAALNLPVVTPVFMETRGGAPRIVSFYAKKARGAMARFIVENRLRDAEALRDFNTGGYAYDAGRSTPDKPVFLRDEAAALAA
ncbi:peroxide stress protein YaaA [Fluviibacterium sp. DFM31]|uniref:UPF0246 protein AB0T83_04755 n=1 Tax=Meridianimarinicoccus marinus TaxID=3231483 RepID=A0ABV3L4S8_9RHOB